MLKCSHEKLYVREYRGQKHKTNKSAADNETIY